MGQAGEQEGNPFPVAAIDHRKTILLVFVNTTDLFRMLAQYNRVANQRLYESCAQLPKAEYRLQRHGSFNSIHNLLNHMLLGDRIWMSRFRGDGHTAPPLNAILFETFGELRSARVEEDESIQSFFENVGDGFLKSSLAYTNNQGRNYVETAPVAALHFFNHQTHHRGQVHVMISQTPVDPPSLDLHRILNP
jgi:uncharacterized damage-inducible protein DinB